jgi:hypothetical protein
VDILSNEATETHGKEVTFMTNRFGNFLITDEMIANGDWDDMIDLGLKLKEKSYELNVDYDIIDHPKGILVEWRPAAPRAK